MAALAVANNLESLEEKRGQDLAHDFVVWSFKDGFNGGKFLAFKSAKIFYKFLSSLKPEKRTFCETVLAVKQKPRFDLDIKKEELPIMCGPERIVSELCYAIKAAFKQIQYEDMQIYSSNTKDGSKYSYHIVINNWYHNNCSEAKRAYELVTRRMPPDMAYFVDDTVYKPLQQFRMLLNTKPGENRPKNREKEWNCYGTVIISELTEKEEFYSSLLTNTDSCQHLKLSVGSIDDRHSNYGGRKLDYSEDGDIDQLLELVPDGYILDPKKKAYGYHLRRVKRSFCLICKRTHGTDSKGDNARIVIKNGEIYFYCFRDDKKRRYLLDTIGAEDTAESTVQEEATKLTDQGLCTPDSIAACEPKQLTHVPSGLTYTDIMTILAEQQNRILCGS